MRPVPRCSPINWSWTDAFGTVETLYLTLNQRYHPLFFTYRSYYSYLSCKSTAITCQRPNWPFLSLAGIIIQQSYVKMPGVRLRETENKRVCQIFGLKSGSGLLFRVRSLTREFLKQYLTERQDNYSSGRVQEVVATYTYYVNWFLIISILIKLFCYFNSKIKENFYLTVCKTCRIKANQC